MVKARLKVRTQLQGVYHRPEEKQRGPEWRWFGILEPRGKGSGNGKGEEISGSKCICHELPTFGILHTFLSRTFLYIKFFLRWFGDYLSHYIQMRNVLCILRGQ